MKTVILLFGICAHRPTVGQKQKVIDRFYRFASSCSMTAYESFVTFRVMRCSSHSKYSCCGRWSYTRLQTTLYCRRAPLLSFHKKMSAMRLWRNSLQI
ncbi:hypothetical protein PHLGIDRAFT_181796 [Phlebiopsis gigantea 11061_1 CR5-6]|uniref:Uncharacterized protein n=1 Tax=Phlebiopsis gigantea (strain 11061_1 CR5-6) TaxID=745531 RepID=A0A0C3NIM3_PHLG1|nr:hypothetical protein PHLGIDRAFT_181796 [Phlebiopsis gigantea 11061_1 CR5-6]